MAEVARAPGVYVKEVAGGMPPIAGVSTSTGAFAGIAEDAYDHNGDLIHESQPGKFVKILGWSDYKRFFGGFLNGRYLAYAVYNFFAEGGTQCYVARAVPDASHDGAPTTNTSFISGYEIRATSEGVWGNDVQIEIEPYPQIAAAPAPKKAPAAASSSASGSSSTSSDGDKGDADEKKADDSSGGDSSASGSGASTPASSGGGGALQQFTIKIYYNPTKDPGVLANQPKESYFGIKLSKDEKKGIGIPKDILARINENSTFIRIKPGGQGDVNGGATATGGKKPLGSNGRNGSYDFAAALELYKKVEDANLMLAPDLVCDDVYGVAAPQTTAYNQIPAQLAKILPLLDYRKSSMFFIDPPRFQADGKTKMEWRDIQSWRGDKIESSSYWAMYYPWLHIPDPTGGPLPIAIPPSGSMGGIYARTDNDIGVWKAPAGQQTGQVTAAVDLDMLVDEDEQGQLNAFPVCVNVIRKFPDIGSLVYGARTLSSDEETKYVPVRRLLMYIEQSLKFGTQWAVFEPNEASLWTLLKRDVSDFLTPLWHAGALVGSTPAAAFTVICDASNNTPRTVDLGELHVDIGVAPVRPAEFIMINIAQKIPGA